MELLGIRFPFGNRNDDYDLDGDYDDEEIYEEGPGGTALKPRRESYRQDSRDVEEKPVRKFRPRKNANKSEGMEICMIKPQTMDDARELTDSLLSGQTVLLNLEGIDRDTAQRIIDFACGSTYAVRGTLQNISNYIYVIAPQSVGFYGEFPQSTTGSFDFKSLRG